MLKLGYKLMSEEHGPLALVRNATRAEQAGFDFAAISDHFFPWLEEQGHAPFAWSVLGALANATRRMALMTAVTCPIMRYHPAIIAQATATMALLSNGRFTLGLGAGERLNEHVIGAGWPGRGERQERFAEAIEIIQGLLAGELTNYRGRYFQLDHARLFDRPNSKPPVAIAAGGIEAARLAGRKGDALVATEARSDLVKAFISAGGSGPRYAEVALCYAEHVEAVRKTAHRYFRWSVTEWPVMAELPDTEGFAAASKHVSSETVSQLVSCGPSAEHPSASDRALCHGGLRSHCPGADRTGARWVHRIFRARARPRARPSQGRIGVPRALSPCVMPALSPSCPRVAQASTSCFLAQEKTWMAEQNLLLEGAPGPPDRHRSRARGACQTASRHPPPAQPAR
jgi:G6PDH family F420-dependent oxidoreductase